MAWNSVSEVLSSCSQPGTQVLSTAGSFSFAQTVSRLARSCTSPLMVIAIVTISVVVGRWYRALPAREERPFGADLLRGFGDLAAFGIGVVPADRLRSSSGIPLRARSLDPSFPAHATDLQRLDAGGRGRPRACPAH